MTGKNDTEIHFFQLKVNSFFGGEFSPCSNSLVFLMTTQFYMSATTPYCGLENCSKLGHTGKIAKENLYIYLIYIA